MTAPLWASRRDRRRIKRARSAVLMVGGYDGSGNFGDVLQFAEAVETVRSLPGSPLAIAIVERAAHDHHARLARRHFDLFDGIAFAFYLEGEGEFGDRLVELPTGIAPARSALYLYGGGYLNRWWGARKIGHVRAAERLAGQGALPVVASGLQVEEPVVEPGGIAHELLSRASWVGLRDIHSLEHVRANVAGTSEAAELVGDDAIPALNLGCSRAEAVVNLHLNQGPWVCGDPDPMTGGLASALRGLGQAAGTELSLQPIVAYEDPRTSESAQLGAFLERHGDELDAAGLRPTAPLNVLDDATGNDLLSFRRARLTVCCSYHVALSSLLAGIPTVLLAENGYYDQKAAGLRDLFDLEPGLVGAGVAELAPAAVAAVLLSVPTHATLTGHLRTRAREVAERQARGREEVSAALSGAA